MRYYYQDDVVAAYMYSFFHVRFYPPEKSVLAVSATDVDVDPKYYMGGGRPRDWKFVIHPDSLPIFKPKVGDLISINGGESASIITHTEFLEQIAIVEHQFASPLRIIQRSGLPFIWPETEEE